MIATLLQIAGLILFGVGAFLEFGVAGVLAAVGLVAVYVGLAMERD